MQVAKDNAVVGFRRPAHSADIYRAGGLQVEGVAGEPVEPRDPRGLVVSILLCMGCWAVLAAFLLT